jgi:hypothetical protein
MARVPVAACARKVRISASPKCPALPVTKMLMTVFNLFAGKDMLRSSICAR